MLPQQIVKWRLLPLVRATGGTCLFYIDAVTLKSVFVTRGEPMSLKVHKVVLQKFSSADTLCICGSKRKTRKNSQLYQSLTVRLGGTWGGSCA